MHCCYSAIGTRLGWNTVDERGINGGGLWKEAREVTSVTSINHLAETRDSTDVKALKSRLHMFLQASRLVHFSAHCKSTRCIHDQVFMNFRCNRVLTESRQPIVGIHGSRIEQQTELTELREQFPSYDKDYIMQLEFKLKIQVPGVPRQVLRLYGRTWY